MKAILPQAFRFSPASPGKVSLHNSRAPPGQFLRLAKHLLPWSRQTPHWNRFPVLCGTAPQKGDLRGHQVPARFLPPRSSQGATHGVARQSLRCFSDKKELRRRMPAPLRPCLSVRYSCASRRHGSRNRSEEHTSELQSHLNLVCRLLLEKKKNAEPPFAIAYLVAASCQTLKLMQNEYW